MDHLRQSLYGRQGADRFPGQTVTIKDSGAYGCILTQGFGTIGGYQCETAGMLRFGQLSADEFFVGETAATDGVKITNHSICEPLVILKHLDRTIRKCLRFLWIKATALGKGGFRENHLFYSLSDKL